MGWFLATIFPMPEDIFKKLEKLILAYIWKGPRKNLIKKEVLYLPRKMGGLGLLHALDQGRALRLKFIHDIVNKHYNRNWLGFARYWLRQILYTINTHPRFSWQHM